MKKKATGLTSLPMSDVPGSENVEIKNIKPEDAETANHGGFNQIEPSSFDKTESLSEMELNNLDFNIDDFSQTSQKEVMKSANYIFNITKVSKNMKKELIKLNAALNGLGYKNLVKMAQTFNDLIPSISSAKAEPGKYYLWPEVELVIKVNNSFVGGTFNDTEMNFDVIFSKKNRPIYYGLGIVFQGRKGVDDDRDDDINPKLIPIPQQFINASKTYQDVVDYLLGTKQLKSDETPASAGGSGSNTRSEGVTGDPWERYAKSFGNSTQQIAGLWRSNPPNGYTGDYSSFQRWWSIQNSQGKGSVEKVLETLQNLNTPAPATPPAIPAAPAPAPASATVTVSQPPTQAVVKRRSLATIEFNGQLKNVAPLGSAYGGDTILIDIDSLNTDKPILYLLDNKTGTTTEIGSAQVGRVRQFLGSGAEKVRARRALKSAGVSEGKINAFFEYMGLYRKKVRRDGLFSTLEGRERRDQALTDAGEKLKSASSARQSRLDNLKKKGII